MNPNTVERELALQSLEVMLPGIEYEMNNITVSLEDFKLTIWYVLAYKIKSVLIFCFSVVSKRGFNWNSM